MAGQTFYGNILAQYAGQRVGDLHSARTGVNNAGSVRQQDLMVVDTFAATTAYQFEVDVGAGPVPVAIVSGATGDVESVRNQLLNAAYAIADFNGVVAFNPSSTDGITLTAIQPGTGFTSTETDTRITRTQPFANTPLVSIPFGRGVVWTPGSTSPDPIQLPSATGQKFQGVLERIHTVVDPKAADTDPASLAPFNAGTVIHRGLVVVEIEEAVTPADAVFIRFASGAGGTILGRFRTDADTATADAVVGAGWVDVKTVAGLAVLSLATP